ncbi:MAG: LuxR C-terminal-related transcriptional regulator, partial [Candidatus Limnocylindria bacterium]
VYSGVLPGDRREAHRALSLALVDQPTDDRWAWHRALAAVGPDEPAALALETVAEHSTSMSAKARALERSAHLTPSGPGRSRRLGAAAHAAEDSGDLQAAETLATEARTTATDAVHIAEIDHLLGRVWTRRGEIERAVDVLTTSAAAVAAYDVDRAALMLADAVEAGIDDLERATKIAVDAERFLRRGSAAEQLVLLRAGDIHGWRGDVEEAARAWRRAADLADPQDPYSLRWASAALFSMGIDADAARVATAAVELARTRHAMNPLTQSLETLGQAEARRGRLRAGIDAITEFLDLVVALGHVREERYARVDAAWIEAALGRDAEVRGHVERALELEARMGWVGPHSVAVGVLELALGRPDLAVEAFEASGVGIEQLHADAIGPRSFVPAYVDALVRVGRASDARSMTATYRDVAARSRRPLAVALALRATGLVETSTDDLQSSADILAKAGNAYEEARTRLCLGELLRRQRKRAASTAHLRKAVDTFEAVGADAWANRARAELGIAGATSRSRSSARADELTPQERNVARLVASGRSNREIAGRLFVTTNTVETHLRHIFQKLDVTSRTQLAIAFRESFPGEAEPAS